MEPMDGPAGSGGGGGSGNYGEAMDMAARVVKPQEVLESLMNDGTFDALRGKVTAHLKNNEDLKRYTQSLVENSQSLNSPGAENKTRRELFDALRRELEGPVLDRASKAAWELILSKEGLGKEIADAVDSTYGKLSTQAESAPYQPEARTPSQERQNADNVDKRTPSQERGMNGYYSQPASASKNGDGRDSQVGMKRDREYVERSRIPQERDGSRDREFSERSRDRDREYSERPRIRDRDVYERRDASREREREYPERSRIAFDRDVPRDQDFSRDGRELERGQQEGREFPERGRQEGRARDREFSDRGREVRDGFRDERPRDREYPDRSRMSLDGARDRDYFDRSRVPEEATRDREVSERRMPLDGTKDREYSERGRDGPERSRQRS